MGHLSRVKIKGSLSTFENVLERIRIFKTWYKIIFPFNRFFRGVQKMNLRNGKSVYVRSVRSMDVNIVSDVLGNNEYEIPQLHLKKDAKIVDLGGNIGTFAIEMHRLFPSAQIVSYEPHPGNAAMFRLNAPQATLIEQAAVGKSGPVRLEDIPNFVGLRVVQEGGIEVVGKSLDDILEYFDVVDLLKVDIEGSEYDLLNHASAISFSKIKKIIMETHDIPGFDDIEWAETILTKHGFKVSWIDKLGIVYGEKKTS